MKAAKRELSPSHRSARASCLAFAFVALTLLAFAPVASADIVFGGTQGPGAGQTDEPRAIAIDREAGLLYVADRKNNRIDVFEADGSFLRAFGWGVADGTTPALQTCTATCFEGIGGEDAPGKFTSAGAGGAGEFSFTSSIAVDNDPSSPAHHDVYVTDDARVQRFSTDDNGTPANPADDFAVFERAWGGGVISAGASGTGDLVSGSTTITDVKTTARRFYLGQRITAPGKIPAGTRIVGLGEGTITLSQPASGSGTAVAISAPEGVGHVAVNEVHELVLDFIAGSYRFEFNTSNPSPSEATTKLFTYVPATPAATIQAQIEELTNIDPGDVAVSGPAGGPWMVEFKGRYADTNVGSVKGESGGAGEVEDRTIENGASAAGLCTAANAADCAAGVRGDGPGQFAQQLRVAVGQGGAVYVADERANIGDSETVDDRDPHLQIFDPAGASAGELPGIDGTIALAVEASGDIYAADSSAVRKYNSVGTLLDTIHASSNIHAIALDPAGNLFVADSTGAETAVYEYDSAGNPVHTFYGNETLTKRPLSLAPYSSATGDLFVLEESSPRRLAHIAKEPPGPVVLPITAQAGPNQEQFADTKATKVSNLSATLNTRLNPEGKSSTVHFQYVDDASFKAEGGFASPKTVTTPESASVGSDFTHHDASFAIPCAGPGNPGCLVADTVYHFRAVATNADGVDNGPEASFKTLPPITLGGVWATSVETDSARLHAALNPNGIAATAHFEYVDDATYQASGFANAQKTPLIDFGSGTKETSKSTLIHPLAENTTYHYRYVAEDIFGIFTGPERTLTTVSANGPAKEDCPNQVFRTGASANLPDCRAYEMVSPLDKNNRDIFAGEEPLFTALGNAPGHVNQATPTGEALTYTSGQAFGDAQSAPFYSQYIARRAPTTGWSTRSLTPPREGISLYAAPYFNFFAGFSEDLCSAWFVQDTDLALVPGASPGVPNLYRRRNCGEEGYELLTTAAPNEPAPGFGKESEGNDSRYYPTIQGFSDDGTTSAFKAPAKLTPEASEADIYQTYLNREGALHLVSVLPKGDAAKTHSSVGTALGNAGTRFFDSVDGAVSDDGSRVFWSAEIDEPPLSPHTAGPIAGSGPSRLYLRLNATQKQSKVSKGKCTEAAKSCTVQITEGAARFRAADPQATMALYTEGAVGSEDLYELDVAKAAKYEAGAATLIAHKVMGLLGQSEDLSRVYLVSSDAIAGAKANEAGKTAEAGKPNLYLYERGVGFSFIGTLSSEGGSGGDALSWAHKPVDRSARVSDDGLHAAFMSRAPLTGYDNTDANSGRPDDEVFLYDAAEGRVICASCNPSGARPGGREVKGSVDGNPAHSTWAAAQIPGWENQWHPAQVLSEDGNRLYFESFEALVARDTNGKTDVYQWERAESKEECLGEIGGERFVPQSEGCLSLISSGKGAKDAEFVDASASGSDVFFTTDASLVSQDYGLVDIYDARVNGGFPPPPGPPGSCEGEACQVAPPPPNDQTPASAAFKGAGNVNEKPRRSCRKGKVRRRGKCVARKKAKRQRQRQKRANNKRGAGR